jgi:hypothetical protein
VCLQFTGEKTMRLFRWLFNMFGAPRRPEAVEDRAFAYVARFPNDEAAAMLILTSVKKFRARSARQVAEMSAGRLLSDPEWKRYGARWERAWKAIV